MSDELDTESPEDETLMAQLRSAVSRADPVPAGALVAARSAFAWRNLDAELARLTADSIVDAGSPALVRGQETVIVLGFDGPGLTIEVQVSVVGDRRRLLGQLEPPQAGLLEIRHREGRVAMAADDLGRFTVDDLPPGPVSLRGQAGGGQWVETDWFLA